MILDSGLLFLGHLVNKEHINFIEPPNSRAINPMEYAIWGALQQRVYHQRRFKTVEELKRAIVNEWQKLSHCIIDNSTNEWRRRLEAVIILNTGISSSVCFAR